VMAQNAADGGNRRYILVQLPEPLAPENKDQKTAANFCDSLGKPRTIAELTKERLRRAGKKVREELTTKGTNHTKEDKKGERQLFEEQKSEDDSSFRGIRDFRGSIDLGFKVFKLDTSNIRTWEPDRANLDKTLEEATQHLKSDRSEEDILTELLLKLGLDLTVPCEELEVGSEKLGKKKVTSIGGGVLMVCLAESITRADAEPLALGIVAWHKEQKPAGECTVVFRDSAFDDDVAKSNLAAILAQHGLKNVRSL